MMTVHPDRPRAVVMERPMPDEPPVMRASLPVREKREDRYDMLVNEDDGEVK